MISMWQGDTLLGFTFGNLLTDIFTIPIPTNGQELSASNIYVGGIYFIRDTPPTVPYYILPHPALLSTPC